MFVEFLRYGGNFETSLFFEFMVYFENVLSGKFARTASPLIKVAVVSSANTDSDWKTFKSKQNKVPTDIAQSSTEMLESEGWSVPVRAKLRSFV